MSGLPNAEILTVFLKSRRLTQKQTYVDSSHFFSEIKFKASLKVSKSVIFLRIGSKEFYQTFKMRVFEKTKICSKNGFPDILAHFFRNPMTVRM